MKYADWKWAVVGAAVGLFTAFTTLDGHWVDLTSGLVSRAIGNVVGSVIGMLIIVYFVRWVQSKA